MRATTACPAALPARSPHYRLPDLPQGLADIDGLLAEYPNDPYFHELKGQMLFENGHIEEAIPPYREAVRLAPEFGPAQDRARPRAGRDRRFGGQS